MGQRTRGIWCGGAECKVLISTYFTIRIDPLQTEEKWLFSSLWPSRAASWMTDSDEKAMSAV